MKNTHYLCSPRGLVLKRSFMHNGRLKREEPAAREASRVSGGRNIGNVCLSSRLFAFFLKMGEVFWHMVWVERLSGDDNPS